MYMIDGKQTHTWIDVMINDMNVNQNEYGKTSWPVDVKDLD